MTAITHTRKPNDDHSKWSYTLRDRDGNTIDVSSVTAVDLFVDDDQGNAEVNGQSVTDEDFANGDISYVFGSNELDADGTFTGEVVINRNSGTTFQHVPHDRNLTFEVVQGVQGSSLGEGDLPTAQTPFHSRKPGDDETDVEYTLKDRNGNAIDVSSVTAIRIYANAPDGTSELSGASLSTVNAGGDGRVEYDVQSGDFATVGDYPVDFEIEYGDGSTQIVPHDGVEKLTVTDQVK
jgi:nitrogen fixation protein FixH